jgi:aspartate aminotransferase
MRLMRINPRVSAIPLSATLALDAKAKELVTAGRDIVNMTAGEPDFDSPEVVKQAAKRIVDEGRVRYTPAAGRLEVRRAIAAHLTRTRGVSFEAEQVTVCHSCKHALSGAIISLVQPEEEVLLLLPAWVSYDSQIRYAGGVPVGVQPRPDMGPDFAALEEAITPRTRGLLLNSPNNPSGYVATPAEVERLCAFARAHDLWLLSDEIYSRLVYEREPFSSPVQFGPDARARTVIVDGASKSYSMTGYRIGFIAATPELAETVERLHSQLTGAPNAISQEAYLAALLEEPPEVEEMAREFDLRRRHILRRLSELGLKTPEPRGAFYVFPDIRGLRPDGDSAALCTSLLEDHGLAAVPGTAFGLEGHIRLSYACSLQKIDAGLDRLQAFIQSQRPS